MASNVDDLVSDGACNENPPIELGATAINEDSFDILLPPDFVKEVERYQLDEYEKVSISFLFYDDPGVSLEICSKILSNKNFCFISNFVLANPPECWSMKFIECIYRIKNFYILERIGLNKHDAQEKFKKSHLLPDRLILYDICELLTEFEKSCVMDSVESVPNEKYLESFFLKLTKHYQWSKTWLSLHKLHNSNVSNLLERWDDENIENSLIRSLFEEGKSPAPNICKSFESNCYPIKDPDNVGFCLIINEMEVKGKTARKGSDIDVAALKIIFSKFKFSITVMKDVPESFFNENLLETISNSFKKNHSIFVFVVMSHGSEGKICSADGNFISIDTILRVLNKAPELRGIPKMLIVQACQGVKLLQFLPSAKPIQPGPESAVSDISEENLNLKDNINEPISDTVILMSTITGFMSFRNENKGSIFIQILCNCLLELPNEEILQIMTEVIRRVTCGLITAKENIVIQHPTSWSYLKKKLFLRIPIKHSEVI